MQITLTQPEAVVFRNLDFIAILAKIEVALRDNQIVTDPANGYGEHIRVDADTVEEWMKPWIEKIYGKAGWNHISFKFIDRIMFMIPSP